VLLGRLRIRGKLVLLVVIPLLAVVALTVPVVLGRVQVAGRASDTADKVQTAGKVGGLLQDLQQERMIAVGLMFQVADKAAYDKAAKAVDDHVEALKNDRSVALPVAVRGALDHFSDVQDLRRAVLSGSTTPDKMIAGYAAAVTRVIESLGLERGVDLGTTEGRQTVALDAALRIDEGITAGVSYLMLVAASKNQAALVPYYVTLNATQNQANRLLAFGTTDQANLYLKVQDELAAKLGGSFNDIQSQDLNPLSALALVPFAQIFPALQSVVGVGRGVENRIVADVTRRVQDQENAALTVAYVVGGLSLLVLLGVLLLSAAVARAVVRPLTRLTGSADRVARVAENELIRVADDEADSTQPLHLGSVEITASDEIGDLARAFERVQGTATGLVERQVNSRRNVAQMFGHIGRRTHNLVARQIALIDRLERNETDAERLQHLYRLDHVSSRLRRNASALIVLSGSAGVDEQVTPLPLADVVRLALGEIEDYTRVDVLVPPDLAIAPSLVHDLVLMLAELMENATTFSPPHKRVTVSARQQQYGAEITVMDHGIGMAEVKLTQENARLERRERLDLVPTEVLGLFVVGRLARRHNMRVALSPTVGGGLTATVLVGRELLPVIDPAVAPVSASPLQGRPISAPPSIPQSQSAARPMALPTAPSPAFDPAAVNRAAHIMSHLQPWSGAFNSPPPDEVPAFPELPMRRAAHAAPEPAVPPVVQPVVVPQEPIEETTGGLRRRVPGSSNPTMPMGVARVPPPKPSEAAEVRALVEDFESGVRRANAVTPSSQPAPLQVPPQAPPQLPPQVSPQRAAEPVAPPAKASGNTGALTRRNPGRTLEALQSVSRTKRASALGAQRAPADPDEVRDLVQQYEAGVTRALREVRNDEQ
jgi:signal transduction histidine kinase